MSRPLALVCSIIALIQCPPIASADGMDPALSRLRYGCNEGAQEWCADNELFERLASEYATTMAPPLNSVAPSGGPKGFYIGLDTTITGIAAEQTQWLRGTEGEGSAPGDLGNYSPSSALVWNRLLVRKGLPFGFSLGSSLAQGIDTTLWTLGFELKWTLVEGFRSGLGQLPDLALRLGWNRSVGSSQMKIETVAFDVMLSKPFVIERAWELSPLIGVQTLFTSATSGVIDLTPEIDGFEECAPQVDGDADDDPVPTRCADGSLSSDLDNSVVFDPVSNTRVRLALGAQARFDVVVVGAALMFDLLAPDLQTEPLRVDPDQESVESQLAFSLSVGVAL